MGIATTTSLVRILLVDDHAVVRAGVRRLLSDHAAYEVCGEASTAREAIEQAELRRPDVIVLDIGLPDADGLDIVQTLRAKGHGCSILVLSMYDEPARVARSFSQGADGYLLKDASESELVGALEALRRGERYLYPPLGAAMIKAASAPATDSLTSREREIVRLLALGHTNAEIATVVHLSTRTVETHRAHAMAKLRLASRAELVRWALDRGMLAP